MARHGRGRGPRQDERYERHRQYGQDERYGLGGRREHAEHDGQIERHGQHGQYGQDEQVKGEAEMARRRTGQLVKADADAGLPVPRPQPGAIEPAGAAGPGDGLALFEGGEIIEGPGGAPAERPEEILAQPPDARDIAAELAAPPRRKLPWLTLVLSACVVAAGAFAGGALVEKHHLNGTPGGGRGNAFAAAASRGGTGTGTAGGRTFGGFGGAGTGATAGAGTTAGAGNGTGTGTGTAAGGAGARSGTGGSGVTIGTVKLVDGNTIYVTDASGNIVKVTTGASTKVTEAKDGKVADLQPGQSVTVRGSDNGSGEIAATTVTQGEATAGGFGGFGGFGNFGGAGGGTGAAGGTGGGN